MFIPDPLLSICIPTFNRSELLDECLEEMLTHLDLSNTNVEIIISNNASTDSTSEILKKWKMKLPQLRIYEQKTNIGAERNFYFLAEHARGEYLWVFGDDDHLNSKQLQFILDKMWVLPGIDVMIINFRIFSKDFTELKRSKGLPWSRDVNFLDKHSIMAELGLNLGYISSTIVRRNVFLKTSFEEYSSLAHTGFAFAFAVYAGLKNNSRLYLLSTPLIDNRGDNSSGFNWYKYFVEGSSEVFNKLVNNYGYSKAAAFKAKRGVLRQYVILDLLVRKRDLTMTSDIWPMLLKNYRNIPLFWFLAAPIIMAPSFLIKIMWQIFRNIRSISRKLQ